MSTADYSFGNWVKRRRKALDQTQQELAQRVGCSLATIVKIESDERRPSRQIAELLVQYLEIPAEQREQFLKVARKERSLEALGEIDKPNQAPLPRVKNQISQAASPLIGREFELTEITRLIEDEDRQRDRPDEVPDVVDRKARRQSPEAGHPQRAKKPPHSANPNGLAAER